MRPLLIERLITQSAYPLLDGQSLTPILSGHDARPCLTDVPKHLTESNSTAVVLPSLQAAHRESVFAAALWVTYDLEPRPQAEKQTPSTAPAAAHEPPSISRSKQPHGAIRRHTGAISKAADLP